MKWFRSKDYPEPTDRHWKCKLGYHAWEKKYRIGPFSSFIPWHGHYRLCTRPKCDRKLFHFFPPEGDIEYVNPTGVSMVSEE